MLQPIKKLQFTANLFTWLPMVAGRVRIDAGLDSIPPAYVHRLTGSPPITMNLKDVNALMEHHLIGSYSFHTIPGRDLRHINCLLQDLFITCTQYSNFVLPTTGSISKLLKETLKLWLYASLCNVVIVYSLFSVSSGSHLCSGSLQRPEQSIAIASPFMIVWARSAVSSPSYGWWTESIRLTRLLMSDVLSAHSKSLA